MNLTVKDLGEQGLLPILQKYCPAEIIGDDGAILSLKDGYSLVVTTDVLVNNVHFSDLTTSPEDVGWRAAAANLSDLAAMGAEPLGITVGLALTPNLAIDWLEGLYRGLS
ncbi:MAG: AIR synthase related protein, partial [Microcystis sp.]